MVNFVLFSPPLNAVNNNDNSIICFFSLNKKIIVNCSEMTLINFFKSDSLLCPSNLRFYLFCAFEQILCATLISVDICVLVHAQKNSVYNF